MTELSKFIVKSTPTIRRHFGKRRNDCDHFNVEYLENCPGTTGTIPADLK